MVTMIVIYLQQGGEDFQAVIVSRHVLRSLSRTEVIICKWPKPLRNRYYKNLMPDVIITKCPSCNMVSHDTKMI